MQPIDYSTDVQTPFQAAVQGYQFGSAIRQDQLAQQQQELAQQRQQQMRLDLANLVNNPSATASDYGRMTVLYPELKDQLKQGWDMASEGQRKGNLNFATQTYAALMSGRPDVAQQLISDRVSAMKAAGVSDSEIQQTQVWGDMIKQSPDQAKHMGGLLLASVMGPEKFTETFSKLGEEQRAQDMAPAALRKAGAEATTAEVTAQNAPANAALDLQKKGWDIQALQADIDFKKIQSRVALINTAIAKETNALKRQELGIQLQKVQGELDDKIREKASAAESGAASIDNMLNTIERVKSNKSLDSVVGTWQGRMPALVNDEASDAIALIDTLGSQAFLAQVPTLKGLGQLSDAEGKKLQSALTNLSRVQSEKQFRANLDEAARILTKARKNLATRYGMPIGSPDTPAAPGSRPPLSSFQR